MDPVETEPGEFDRLIDQPGIVTLVRREQHRLAAGADVRGDLLVERDHAILRVGNQNQDVGVFKRRLDLPGDPAIPDVDPARLPGERSKSAGVDQLEMAPSADQRRDHPVAGDSGHLVHDRKPAPDNRVEERGFPDIRTTDDRDGRNPDALI